MSHSSPQLHVDRTLMAAVVLAVLGISHFTYSLPRAMHAYPGGTMHQAWTKGYSWSGNWVSDLGRTVAWNGDDNRSSSTLFNRSIALMGISLAVFFVASFRATESLSLANSVSSFAGFVSSCGLVGIGATPFDLHHDAHLLALFTWIIPMILVAIAFAIESNQSDPRFGKLMLLASCALVALIGAYAVFSQSRWVMTLQKVVVLASIGWLALLVSRVALTGISIVTAGSKRLQKVNAQAAEYSSRLKSGKSIDYRRYD